jgi:penicillin-binding protein 1C
MRRRTLLLAASGLGLGVAILVVDRVEPPDLHRLQDSATAVLDRSGALLDAAPARDGAFRLATTYEQVDPTYLRMLLATEDGRFWWHPGIDPFALARAAWQLGTHGRIVSGGSTLTMQVARLLTPHRRSWRGKLQDCARALQLEAHFSKRQILDMYLTLAPEGGAIEGIRAASLAYFGHAPAHFTPTEAALLVAIPRDPTRLRPDRDPTRSLAAAGLILARTNGPAPGILPAIRRVAHDAPHLRDRLRGTVSQTTIDGPLQRTLLGLAGRERPALGDHANLAIVVVRNADRAVLAYIGGADYFGPLGMNDMLRAPRSPGSALKPLIYGLAFDDGLLQPNTLVQDRRDRLGDYAPRDFDHVFHGEVTAAEALRQSYNMPAVALLARVGAPRFVAALRQAGAALRLPRGALPTLPVALGGIAITPFDLARLYAALANAGQAAPLRLTADAAAAPGVSLLSAVAAADVGDILRATPPPDGTARAARPIAYKTGTSYGFRDAWAAGWSPAYTVVVWTGRTDGTPRPAATGRAAAAPLLFHVFDILPGEPASTGTAPEATPRGAAPYRSAAPPRIIFPPPNALLDASAGPSMTQVGLEATGGQPPYRWLVDGVPLPAGPIGANPSWTPASIGFAHIAVVDSADHGDGVNVRVR